MRLDEGTREFAANPLLPVEELLARLGLSLALVHPGSQGRDDVERDFEGVFKCSAFGRSGLDQVLKLDE